MIGSLQTFLQWRFGVGFRHFFCAAVTLLGACLSLASSCVSAEKGNETAPNFMKPTNCKLSTKKLDWSGKKTPKLVFISIDSLNAAGLNEYVPKLSTAHPDGFKRILANSNNNHALIVHNPTITSSSHTSTITCSSAEKHGVFANAQWNGEKTVSGFNIPIQTETFPTAISKAGLKVVTAGYPTLDNSEQGRQVSEGFAYGDTHSQPTVVKLSRQAATTHAWLDSNGKEISKILIELGGNNKLQLKCLDANCRVLNPLNDGLSPVEILTGKRKSTAYILPLDENSSQVYISQLASNNSFPESVAATLDDCGIVFSPGKDVSLARFGANAVVAGMEHRLNFFRDAWTRYLPSTNADAIFLYLEDMDALRHQFAGDDKANPLVLKHLEKLDQLLGEFLASLPKETNVVIMGDHGMSTVQLELNIRKILPKEALENGQIVVSGGTLLLYGKNTQAGKSISTVPNSTDLKWLTATKNALERFRLDGKKKPVFEQVLLKDSKEMKDAGLNHGSAPFLIAFANDLYALQNSMEDKLILADLENSKLPPPRPRGQHGHYNQNSSMKSFLSLWGPEMNAVDANNIKQNIDVVPAVAKALGWPTPQQCRGRNQR
jgi:predicted AlkP superfamily pyrophosphatase or phosphodiesterase